MIVARGLGRGTGRVLVTAGLGLVNAASGPPPVLPPLGGGGHLGGRAQPVKRKRRVRDADELLFLLRK